MWRVLKEKLGGQDGVWVHRLWHIFFLLRSGAYHNYHESCGYLQRSKRLSWAVFRSVSSIAFCLDAVMEFRFWISTKWQSSRRWIVFLCCAFILWRGRVCWAALKHGDSVSHLCLGFKGSPCEWAGAQIPPGCFIRRLFEHKVDRWIVFLVGCDSLQRVRRDHYRAVTFCKCLLLPGVYSTSWIWKILDHSFSSNISSVTFSFLPVPQITLVFKTFHHVW